MPKSEKINKKAVGALFVASLLLLSVIVLAVISVPEEVDSLGCASTLPREHVVIVDKTDQWPIAAGQRLTTSLAQLVKSVSKGEKIALYVLTDDLETSIQPKFERCSPGRGSEANFWNEGTIEKERQYVRDFRTPIDGIVSQLSEATERDTTPLVELLSHLILVRQFEDTAVTFYLYSDMRQNTRSQDDGFSLLSNGPIEIKSQGLSQFILERTGGLQFEANVLVRFIRLSGNSARSSTDEANLREMWSQALTDMGISTTWSRL